MLEKLSSTNDNHEAERTSPTDSQLEDLVNTAGPAVPGVEFVSDNDKALRLIGDTAIPGHDGVRGRIVAFDKNGTAVTSWRTEDGNGHQVNAVKAVHIDDLVAYNIEEDREKVKSKIDKSVLEALSESGRQSALRRELLGSKEVVLHDGDAVEIPTDNPLYKDGEMPEGYEHIKGNVLVLIKLPVHNQEDANITSEYVSEVILAVVDYGEDFREKRYLDEAPILGSPTSRFMVRGMNYSPEDHYVAAATISTEAIELGTDPEESENRDLGLNQFHKLIPYGVRGAKGQRSMISRKHLSIELTDGGDGIRITDNSTNHTKVIYRAESEPGERRGELNNGSQLKMLGSLAVNLPTQVEGTAPVSTNEAENGSVDLSVEERIKAIKDDIIELQGGLSTKDAQNLWMYVSNAMNKSEAQREGNELGSTTFGQISGQAYNKLTEKARALAPRYRAMMESLEKLYAIESKKDKI